MMKLKIVIWNITGSSQLEMIRSSYSSYILLNTNIMNISIISNVKNKIIFTIIVIPNFDLLSVETIVFLDNLLDGI